MKKLICPEYSDYIVLLLQSLYKFNSFINSTNRQSSVIEKNNAQKATLKFLSVASWSAKEDKSHSRRKYGKKYTRRFKNEARGLRLKLKRFNAAILACFWEFILHKMKRGKILCKEKEQIVHLNSFNSLIE